MNDDVLFEILKYNTYVKCINKYFYLQMLTRYGNDKITFNELLNYKSDFRGYLCKNNYTFNIYLIRKNKPDSWYVYQHNLECHPKCLLPIYYNTNIIISSSTIIARDSELKILMSKFEFYDESTTNNILSQRLNYKKESIDFYEHNTTDFDIMYNKIKHLMYLDIDIKNLLNQNFKFIHGKLVDRHEEYNNYIQLLDNMFT